MIILKMLALAMATVAISSLVLLFFNDGDIKEPHTSTQEASSVSDASYKALTGQRIHLDSARGESCVFGGLVNNKIVLSYDSFPAYYPLGSKYIFCSGILVEVVSANNRYIELKPAEQSLIEDALRARGFNE